MKCTRRSERSRTVIVETHDFTRRHVREVKRLSIGTEAGAVGAADARNQRLDRPVAGKAIETAIGFSGAALVDAAAEKIAVPVASPIVEARVRQFRFHQIGTASCRERVCRYV